MAPVFFDLPLEIRLDIYSLVFGHGKAIIEAKVEEEHCCLLPRGGLVQNHSQRASQLLRVSSAILLEARPVLYANTIFHVVHQTFAGKLPSRITDGHPCAPHVKHLIWQLDCDMLKHFYAEDLRLDISDMSQWTSLEIRCRADTWRNSFMGEWCDREAFLNGRTQLVEYVRLLHHAMSECRGRSLAFVEDRSQLGRGRVILRVDSERSRPKPQRAPTDETLVLATS